MASLKARHPARLSVANLSSGNQPDNYYDEIYHWWSRLVDALRPHGLSVLEDCPQVYNAEGSGLVRIADESGNVLETCVRWTYYRMQSGRWEIVNYLT